LRQSCRRQSKVPTVQSQSTAAATRFFKLILFEDVGLLDDEIGELPDDAVAALLVRREALDQGLEGVRHGLALVGDAAPVEDEAADERPVQVGLRHGDLRARGAPRGEDLQTVGVDGLRLDEKDHVLVRELQRLLLCDELHGSSFRFV
jgi:hypothetical protein